VERDEEMEGAWEEGDEDDEENKEEGEEEEHNSIRTRATCQMRSKGAS
jgi:hypothetical protein